ncbi:kinase-like domain-containing protein [Chytriomyces sp. MP71]|nr:kinase-like domain-containing protein [Chytriomyces sp. MP71]KAI8619755.1 kinase-like domain-containing protein [Chytriomyces sp. MP71]
MLLVLELAPRGTMMDYIESVQGEGIGQELWMRWAKQLASAVDYVHSFGFVHHDIKPHNCLLTSRKDVKLADFGNALPVQGFQPPQQPVHLLSPGANFTAEPTDIQPSPITTRVNLSPTLSPFHNSVSRDSSSTSCDSRSIRVGSLGPPSPIGFVEKFRSDLENASIRSSRTGSLTDGLGRGTQAYMAPEIFMSTPMKSNGEYSFPADLYAVGATLYVAATGRAPFTLAPSSVYMMMGIRRGFWASGLQPGFGTIGPDVRGGDASGLSMRQSLANGGGERV